MKRFAMAAAVAMLAITANVGAEEYQLPSEVTPALKVPSPVVPAPRPFSMAMELPLNLYAEK